MAFHEFFMLWERPHPAGGRVLGKRAPRRASHQLLIRGKGRAPEQEGGYLARLYNQLSSFNAYFPQT